MYYIFLLSVIIGVLQGIVKLSSSTKIIKENNSFLDFLYLK